jgi:hypothetical protein
VLQSAKQSDGRARGPHAEKLQPADHRCGENAKRNSRRERRREEKQNRQWRSALNELRRKQKRELSKSDNITATQPRKRRRLFRAVAEVEEVTGVGGPQSICFPVYVFARSWREASRLFADALSSTGYKLKKLRPPGWASGVESYVISRPSPQSMELDSDYIRPRDVLRAWDTARFCWEGRNVTPADGGDFL